MPASTRSNRSLTRGVKTKIALTVQHARNYDATVDGRILRDLTSGRFNCPFQNLNAGPLVAFANGFFPGNRFNAFQKCQTAAGHDSLSHRSLGGADGVVERFLFRLHLRFGRSPDADDRDTAGQFGEPFLELLQIIVTGRLFDFTADLSNPAVNPTAVAAAADQRRIFLVRDHPRGAPELLHRHVLGSFNPNSS